MWRSRYSGMFMSTYFPTYKGNSLRKSRHNHRYYFWFPFEVRFCHVIRGICIPISESGNANSQVSKPKDLICWFSQLIGVSHGGFSVNYTDNISALQNLMTYILNTKLLVRIGNWLANSGAMMCSKVNTTVVKFMNSTARDICPGAPKDMILVSFSSERPKLFVDA